MELIIQDIDKSIIRKKEYAEKENTIDGIPVFSIVEFNIWGNCNRSCSFCPVSNPEFYTKDNTGISLKLFQKIINDLNEINYSGVILFSAFSEPFLNKDLIDLNRITKKGLSKAKLEINTNGDVIKKRPEKIIPLFENGLDSLVISIYDGPAAFNEFLNIRETLQLTENEVILRRRYFDENLGNHGMIFSSRTGLVPTNNEIIEEFDSSIKLPLIRKCYYPFYQTLIDVQFF